MRKYFLYIILLSITVSCIEPTDCISKRNNLVGITFKSFQDLETVTSQSIDSVYTESADQNILKNVTASSIHLPLDYTSDSTAYTMVIADTVYHLTFTYDTRIEFVNEQCGERYIISNLNVVKNDFDTLNVIYGTPGSKANVINIEIFN